MIDASAFLSVAGARAAYRRAAPLRDAHVAALAAGFTRRAAPLGCVVQLFAPHRPRRRGRAAGRRCRWRTRTPSTPAGTRPAWAARERRHAPSAAAVLRRLAGHGALNLGALAMAGMPAAPRRRTRTRQP